MIYYNSSLSSSVQHSNRSGSGDLHFTRVSEPACFEATPGPEKFIIFLTFNGLFFTLENISKDVMYYTIRVSYRAKSGN